MEQQLETGSSREPIGNRTLPIRLVHAEMSFPPEAATRQARGGSGWLTPPAVSRRAATLALLASIAYLPVAGVAQVKTDCGNSLALDYRQVLVSSTDQDFFGGDMAHDGNDLVLGLGQANDLPEDFATYFFVGGAEPWLLTHDHNSESGQHRVDLDDNRLVVSNGVSLRTYTRYPNSIYGHEQSSFGPVPNSRIKDVAIDGDFIIAGYGPDDPYAFNWDGLVKIFGFDGMTWSVVATFAAPTDSHWKLGTSVDILGGTAVAGAPGPTGDTSPGRVREYLLSGLGWQEGAELTSASIYTDGDRFGFSVALDGIRLAVGAPLFDVGALPPLTANAGAVFVFKRTFPNLTWEKEAELDGQFTDQQFGLSVALEGEVLVLGAPSAAAGQAAVYRRLGATWALCHALARPSFASNFGLGVTLGTRGFFVHAGHYSSNFTPFDGAVFFYAADLFSDGFESGDPLLWSSVAP